MFGIALTSPHSNQMKLAGEETEAGKGQVTGPRLLTLPVSAMIPGTEGVLGCENTTPPAESGHAV